MKRLLLLSGFILLSFFGLMVIARGRHGGEHGGGRRGLGWRSDHGRHGRHRWGGRWGQGAYGGWRGYGPGLGFGIGIPAPVYYGNPYYKPAVTVGTPHVGLSIGL